MIRSEGSGLRLRAKSISRQANTPVGFLLLYARVRVFVRRFYRHVRAFVRAFEKTPVSPRS